MAGLHTRYPGLDLRSPLVASASPVTDRHPGRPAAAGAAGAAAVVRKVRFQLAVTLDSYVAGPEQSEDNPLGVGGMELHQWVFKLEAWRRQQGLEGGEVNASTPVVEDAQAVQQYLAAGLVDEFELHIVPVLLGAGARLLENGGDLQVQQVRTIEARGSPTSGSRVVKG
jgi:hypothetical protein